MPMELEMFLLATGERGIGYPAVFGDTPLTVERYELLKYMQRRVLQAGTEEGRKELRQEIAIRAAIAHEEALLAAAPPTPADWPPAVPAALPTPMPPQMIPPLDPLTMTADEVRDWLRRYGGADGTPPAY